MGQAHPLQGAICCSLREKNPQGSGFPAAVGTPQFCCHEALLGLDDPQFLSFAPLWQRDALAPRRLAVASRRQVHVYRLPDAEGLGQGDGSTRTDDSQAFVVLEHSLALTDDVEIYSLIFSEETSSKTLAVAVGPSAAATSQGGTRTHHVRLFNCDAVRGKSQIDSSGANGGDAPVVAQSTWQWDKDFAYSIDDHTAPVTLLAANQTTIVTADVTGMCGAYSKSKGFTKKASNRLHTGGLAGLCMDRFFAYTAGREDKCIGIWQLPDLQMFAQVRTEIPKELGFIEQYASLSSRRAASVEDAAPEVALPKAAGASAKSEEGDCLLMGLTALRRPLSRWAGSQGSSRSAKGPKGLLYVAAVMGEDSDVAGGGAGVLMEWALSGGADNGAVCQSVQIAHDSPICNISYGPYDNGPIITADIRGVFRVWDCTPRLCCSQHVEFQCGPGLQPTVSLAVEPQCGLYSTIGDRRLFVWRRTDSHDFVYAM